MMYENKTTKRNMYLYHGPSKPYLHNNIHGPIQQRICHKKLIKAFLKSNLHCISLIICMKNISKNEYSSEKFSGFVMRMIRESGLTNNNKW